MASVTQHIWLKNRQWHNPQVSAGDVPTSRSLVGRIRLAYIFGLLNLISYLQRYTSESDSCMPTLLYFREYRRAIRFQDYVIET